jgi:choice-of-anchor B domain-containing protein
MLRRLALLLSVAVIAAGAVATANPVAGEIDPALAAHQRIHEHKKARAITTSADIPAERLSDVSCEDGQAGPFPCDGVDLLSFVPYDEFVGPELTVFPGLSDIWGWTDSETGDEYVIIGVSNGVQFFRVTDPTDPVDLGKLPNTAALQLIWHDIKVYDDHAFIVSESNPHGMRVFDLTRLRGVTTDQVWTEDARYPLVSAVHNLAINEDSGFAYLVGGNAGIVVPDQCNSGLHMIDINDPKSPTFAGCFADDGYTHDTQCVMYEGPDEAHHDKEICVSSNEDHVAVVDVTDKANPQRLGEVRYEQTAYTHQGWFTEDQAYFLVGDELDEQDHRIPTRTLILDLTDLDNPTLVGEHLHETPSIDHNMYTLDGLVYQSNYTAGLRVLDTVDVADGTLTEVAYFDTYPENDDAVFNGTWSNYPYFESGTIAVSGIDEGLFLLRLQDHVASEGQDGGGGEVDADDPSERRGPPADRPKPPRS